MANVQWLPARGYNVFLLDYRGYGLSEGKPRLPDVFDDVQLGLDWLRHAERTDGAPLVVFGQSLGASMATSVLGEEDNAGAADCVILEAAFASYRDITSDVMKRSWLLWPLRWMVVPTMPDRALDPEERVAGIAPTPLLVMHSEDDPVIPYAHGERLYAAAQQPKTFQTLRGGHTQKAPGTRQYSSAWWISCKTMIVRPKRRRGQRQTRSRLVVTRQLRRCRCLRPLPRLTMAIDSSGLCRLS